MNSPGKFAKRTARPGHRHRRDNGPQELEITPVVPPNTKKLGTLTHYTQEIIKGGPRALIAAQRRASELSAKFGEEVEAAWCLTTPWLQNLKDKGEADGRDVTEKNKLRVRYALTWRPRFLASLSLSGGAVLAARAAGVSVPTVQKHRRLDPDFELQCLQAEAQAIELLHDVAMQRAIEGVCEPVFWQGIVVGHIKKVDNRLIIEMLRAKMPKVFKTPGTKIDITQNSQLNNFVCGPEEQDKLIALRREALERINAPLLALPTSAPATTA